MGLILCIDVGLANIGAVVVHLSQKDELGNAKIEEYAYFYTDKSTKVGGVRKSEDLARRAAETARFYDGLIKKYNIRRIAAEMPHGGARNALAIRNMAYASGVIVSVVELNNCAAEWYTPQEVKKALTGNKNASKEEMMKAAATYYPELMGHYPAMSKREHVSDAIGVWFACKNSTLARL